MFGWIVEAWELWEVLCVSFLSQSWLLRCEAAACSLHLRKQRRCGSACGYSGAGMAKWPCFQYRHQKLKLVEGSHYRRRCTVKIV